MENKKIKAYRHGDICLVETDKIPAGLKTARTSVLIKSGSGGNPHTFKGGSFYPVENQFVLGYLKAKDTKLYHVEHGERNVGGLKECRIADGVYEVRRQVEDTHEGLREVQD